MTNLQVALKHSLLCKSAVLEKSDGFVKLGTLNHVSDTNSGKTAHLTVTPPVRSACGRLLICNNL